MFKNVIVGVDGTPNGRDAVALARRLADPDGQADTRVRAGNEPVAAILRIPGAARAGAQRARGGCGAPAAYLAPAPDGAFTNRPTNRRRTYRGWVLPPWSPATRDARQRHARRSERRRLARSRSRRLATPRGQRRSPRSALPTTGRPRASLRWSSRAELAASGAAKWMPWKSSRSRAGLRRHRGARGRGDTSTTCSRRPPGA